MSVLLLVPFSYPHWFACCMKIFPQQHTSDCCLSLSCNQNHCQLPTANSYQPIPAGLSKIIPSLHDIQSTAFSFPTRSLCHSSRLGLSSSSSTFRRQTFSSSRLPHEGSRNGYNNSCHFSEYKDVSSVAFRNSHSSTSSLFRPIGTDHGIRAKGTSHTTHHN